MDTLTHGQLRLSGAGNRHCARTLMAESAGPGLIHACTQTAFPGSELLDPNPFVPSPIKEKARPGVSGVKEPRAEDEVGRPCHQRQDQPLS